MIIFIILQANGMKYVIINKIVIFIIYHLSMGKCR